MATNDYIKRSDAIFALCGNCEMIEACGMTGDLCDDVKRIEAIPAADVEPKREWIPVTERLPEDGEDVLAWISDEYESRMTAANYDHGVWYDCVMNYTEKRVKYWMYHPEPPKEEEEESK